MKKFFVLGMMAFISMFASAQIVSSNSTRITKEKTPSANYSRLYLGYANMMPAGDTDSDDEALQGLKFGYLKGISLTNKVPLFLQVGGEIQYGTYSDSETVYGYDCTTRLNELGIAIPVSLTYKYTFTNGFYLEPYAGIRFRVNLLANMSESFDGDKETLSFFDKDKMGDTAFKRFQFGGQIGLNFGYKALNVNVGFDMYSPISKANKYKYKYNTVTVGLGVNF